MTETREMEEERDRLQINAWLEQHSHGDATKRAEMARRLSGHLPTPNALVYWSEADAAAMKAAFLARFDDPLPPSESLSAVAMIGYRRALRDLKEPSP